MAHQTLQSGYQRLVERINRFPQGAPPAQVLHQILALLFTPEEAALVAQLPIKPFTADTAARRWKIPLAQTRSTLDRLADRAVILDIQIDGKTMYVLPPPMAGFFEFSLMRVRSDIDQRLLSELFYQYLNVEEDFIRTLFCLGDMRLGRAFVQEPMLPAEQGFTVLDYERASWVVRSSPVIGLGLCYCRHKMSHIGRACQAPMEICMTFNTTASSLVRHGVIKQIGVSECLDLLQQAYEQNLVQFGDNARDRVNFICNCCGCCCEAMIAQRRFGLLHPVHTTNFLPDVDETACTGCGKCLAACPVEALGLVSAHDPQKPKQRKAHVDVDICLGCGVCVRSCSLGALRLRPREKRVITPVNSVHRAVIMAIERGTLQELICDTDALANHRAMAAILGVILKLPPIKQVLANKQVQSRYLGYLAARFRF